MINTQSASILILGAGNMGASIASGLLKQQWPAEQIIFCDRRAERHPVLKQTYPNCQIVCHPSELETLPKVILLSVKPFDMPSACEPFRALSPARDTLYISIAAGVPISAFHSWLGNEATIVRCMSNTPAAIGVGMSGLYCAENTPEVDKKLAETILSSTGKILWVDKETMLDAVTALSGSGPAYFFYLMECLQESGKALGFNSQDSYILTMQTMLGAARLAAEQKIDFATLRANVTSKGGTTEQAINCFINKDLKNIVDQAVKAAAHRASEISQSFTKE